MRLILKSYNIHTLRKLINHIRLFVYQYDQNVRHNIRYIPKCRRLFNILRSPHVDKDSRDQIGISSYKVIIIEKYLCRELLSMMLENINIPASVQVTIIR
ncbi:30S ribosomal protein S10 [Candidatus Vidania fulgoroideorum]